MRSMKPILSVLGVTALLLGPIGLQIPEIGATEAFAGGGNGNGNGNGNGGGNGNSDGNSKGGGEKSSAKKGGGKDSVKKSSKSSDVASIKNPHKTKGAHGLLASELKGLNAAHANPNALANASPNSQVGRLAAYRDAAIATEGAQDVVDGAIADLAAFDAESTGRAVADIEADIAALDPEAEGYDPEQLTALDLELTAAETRDADRVLLENAVTAAELAADAVADSEADALQAMSNGRTLSPEAIDYIRELLNI